MQSTRVQENHRYDNTPVADGVQKALCSEVLQSWELTQSISLF